MGLNWSDKRENGVQGNKNTNIIRHVNNDERREKSIEEYKDLFRNNHTIKDLTIDIHLKNDSKPIQQKGRPVPIHFQNTRTGEIDRKGTHRESRQDEQKLLRIPRCDNRFNLLRSGKYYPASNQHLVAAGKLTKNFLE